MNLFGGDPGIGRLFGASMGAEASWLLPAALDRLGRIPGRPCAPPAPTASGPACCSGAVGFVTGVVFSFMAGTVHPYYNVDRAAAAALVGIAVAQPAARRESWFPRTSAVMLLATGVWSFVLLNRTPEWWAGDPLGRARRFGGAGAAARRTGAPSRQGHRGRRRGDGRRRPRWLGGVLDLQRGQRAQRSRHYALARMAGGFGFGGPGKGGPGMPGRADGPQLEALLKSADNRWAVQRVSARCRSSEYVTEQSTWFRGGDGG